MRIGNAAHTQLQLDMFSKIMDVHHQAPTRRIKHQRIELGRPDQISRTSGADLPQHQGIWEMRGPAQHFTHSKVKAWSPSTPAVGTAGKFLASKGRSRTAAQIARQIATMSHRGYNPELGTSCRPMATNQLDASLLLLPNVGFLPASDPRIAGTIKAIESQLLRNGLVIRYAPSR